MSNVLSVSDFLNLAEERLVARVDLAEVGRKGVLFVRELTSDEKTAVLPRPKGKAKMHKDQSIEIDWSQLSPDAVAKFLKTCLVVVKGDPDTYFSANGHGPAETAVIPVDQLESFYEQLAAKLEKRHLAMEKLGDIPNAVADLLVKRIRQISRLDDEDIDEMADEKKG